MRRKIALGSRLSKLLFSKSQERLLRPEKAASSIFSILLEKRYSFCSRGVPVVVMERGRVVIVAE